MLLRYRSIVMINGLTQNSRLKVQTLMLSLLPLTINFRINFDNIGVEIPFSLSLRLFVLLDDNPFKIKILNDPVPWFWVSNYFLCVFDFIFEHLYMLHESALYNILNDHLSFDLYLALLEPLIHRNESFLKLLWLIIVLGSDLGDLFLMLFLDLGECSFSLGQLKIHSLILL